MRLLHLLYLVCIAIMAPGGYRMAVGEPMGDVTWFFFGGAILLTSLFIFREQIDHWMYQRSTISVDEDLERVLKSALIDYPQAQIAAGYGYHEMRVYNHRISYIEQGMDAPPEDLSHMITSQAFYFRGPDDRWPSHYDRIVVYKHPFLSPDLPDQVHIAEAHEPHGTLLLSMEQVLPGFTPGSKFFNPALFVYADAYVKLYEPDLGSPDVLWPIIDDLSRHGRQRVLDYIGYEVDPRSLILYYAARRPRDLQRVAPGLIEHLSTILPGRWRVGGAPSDVLSMEEQSDHA